MKVEQIIFKEGHNAPSFILEDGSIKNPCMKHLYGHSYCLWLTDKELETEQKKLLVEPVNKKWWQIF